jgi:tripartite-type tricarboxylate transporter receptor subunit TctC
LAKWKYICRLVEVFIMRKRFKSSVGCGSSNVRGAIKIALGATLAAGLLWTSRGQAAEWPTRPVTIVVPFAAGGNTDVIGRIAASYLQQALGQPFIVTNRTGANGAIAARLVAHAEPDGYTLMIAAAPQMVILPALQKIDFDTVKDFTPIKNIATNPFVLMVSRSVPAQTLGELIAYAHANAGKLTYASAGIGSISHLSGAMFFRAINAEAIHVPYQGNGPALNDVIGGRVSLIFANLSEALAQSTNENIRIMAVTSKARLAQLPDIPTVAEGGVESFETATWNGLVGPARLPSDIVKRIADALTEHLQEPAVKARFETLGVEPDLGSTADFAARIDSDLPLWAKAIGSAGLRRDD